MVFRWLTKVWTVKKPEIVEIRTVNYAESTTCTQIRNKCRTKRHDSAAVPTGEVMVGYSGKLVADGDACNPGEKHNRGSGPDFTCRQTQQ